MTTINITLGLAVAVAPTSAPRRTSALALCRGRLLAVVAAATDALRRGREGAVPHPCAIALTSAVFGTDHIALFAHIGYVAEFTAGRGLAQPAV